MLAPALLIWFRNAGTSAPRTDGGCDAWPDVRASQMGRRDPGGSPVKSGEREPREGVYVFEAGTLLSASRFFLPLRPTGRFIAAWSDRLLAAESARSEEHTSELQSLR